SNRVSESAILVASLSRRGVHAQQVQPGSQLIDGAVMQRTPNGVDCGAAKTAWQKGSWVGVTQRDGKDGTRHTRVAGTEDCSVDSEQHSQLTVVANHPAVR